MKVTVKEVVPVPPPKVYILELSEAELAMLRYFARVGALAGELTAAAATASQRFNKITPAIAAWDPDNCFNEEK